MDIGAAQCVRSWHRQTISEIANDFASGIADGAVISAARASDTDVTALAALVRGFPMRQVVGLIGEVSEKDAFAAALLFGRVGVRAIVDVRAANGWRDFRNVFNCASQPNAFIRDAVAAILREIASGNSEACDGRNEFFRAAFSPRVTNAKELSKRLGVLPSTLMSRFFRAGLPSPKQYVATARLVWAAHLAESPAMSVAAIADRLNASSPQTFHRVVRSQMRMSATEFRRAYTGGMMLDVFRAKLVTPYLRALQSFDPLAESGEAFELNRCGAKTAARTSFPGRAA
jgi:AraC-like DNA-binding protein